MNKFKKCIGCHFELRIKYVPYGLEMQSKNVANGFVGSNKYNVEFVHASVSLNLKHIYVFCNNGGYLGAKNLQDYRQVVQNYLFLFFIGGNYQFFHETYINELLSENHPKMRYYTKI